MNNPNFLLAQNLSNNTLLFKDWGFTSIPNNWFPLNKSNNSPLYSIVYNEDCYKLVIVSESLSSIEILNEILYKIKEFLKEGKPISSCLFCVEHFDAIQFSDSFIIEDADNGNKVIKQKMIGNPIDVDIYFIIQKL
ncbi:MAG: hypothetical protein IKG99_10825 [Bacteroidaceae bacterium]|nr:hypothetical protein [Bacteroidaceae bacterium]MBR3454607.1 hypothetical protein [Bacteroidaceae bacterium]